MVHALKMVHDLLLPVGILIDIHPSGKPPVIEVLAHDQKIPIGKLDETDDFIEYFQAEDSLTRAIDAGWFKFQQRKEINFSIYTSSLVEFQEFLNQNWEDAVIPVETTAEFNRLYARQPDSIQGLVATEMVFITRLQKL